MSHNRGQQEDGEPPRLLAASGQETGSPLLILLGLLYLWLCNALFFTGWYQPWISLPLSAALLGTILVCCCRLRHSSPPWHPSARDWRNIAITIIGILAYLIISGQIGFFPTPTDFLLFRQALYKNLADAPWPLILPNGREMTYYLAGMLPAAMMERLMPDGLSQLPVLINTFLPPFLAILLIARRWKCLPLLFVLMMVSLQDPLCMVFRPVSVLDSSQPGFTSECIARLHELTGIDLRVLTSYYSNKSIVAPLRTCVDQYNSQTYTILATALLLNLPRQRALYPLIVAMLFPISPLGALALLPVAACLYLRTWEGIRGLILPSLIPLLAVAACIPYFFRASSEAPTIITLGLGLYGRDSWIAFVRYLAGIALLFLPLWKTRKHHGIYLMSMLTAVFMFCLFVGTPKHAGFPGLNEFSMKGSAVITTVLAVFYMEDWRQLPRIIRVAVAGWLLIVTPVSLLAPLIHFTPHRTVADQWNGHLNHEAPFLRQSIPQTVPHPADFILLKHSGEAEKHFPGTLLPKAPGCDYSRPPKR